jgi:diguanylate cyclase (GGDEF)-like protein
VPHLALLAGYVLLAAYAERFAVTPDGSLSVWYPPPGLVLVVLQRWGLRFWPTAIVAELVVSLVVYDVADDFGLPLTVANAVGVTGAYALGAVIIRRVTDGDGVLDVRADLAWFVLATFLVAAPLAALVGVGAQVIAGFELDGGFARAVVTWWVGDAIGLLVLAPVGYAALRRPGQLGAWVRDGLGRVGLFELGLAAAVPAMPIAVFAVTDPPQPLYLIILPVVLVAVRHGAGPGAWAVLVSVLVTTVAAYEQGGDTIGRTDLQVLLLAVAMTGNAIGLLERLRRKASTHADDLGALMDVSPDLVAIVGEGGAVQWANPAGRRLLGFDAASGPRDPDAIVPGPLIPVDPAFDGGAIAHALEEGTWQGSVRLERPDGERYLSELAVRLPDHHGRRVGLVARDVTDLRVLADQLTRLAFTDELTGLANRARLFERLSFAMERAEAGTLHGLVLIDLDRFAVINDHHGHDAGDAVLRGVSERLGSAVRAGELLARIGDNRFAVLLEDINDEFTAVAAAERLRVLAGGGWVSALGHDLDSIELCASAGVVIAQPVDEPDLVARRADLAIGQAKQAGGDRTCAYDSALSDRLGERIRIEGMLRDALGGGGWPLRYQPVVRLETVEVVGCEALLVPKAPPLEVIAVAEELGLIGRLGEQVLCEALAQAVAWRKVLPDLHMGVNMSAHQLLDPDFPEVVARELERSGVPADALVLEVTETAFADDLTDAVDAATALRGLGVQLSIDDFGTGFSSLGRLRSLPVDELKLDRTFVADLGKLDGAESIVAAVVALGAARSLGVVAEGVEEDAQRRSLLDLGCTLGQGWLFAYPMPPGEFEAWVGDHLGA